MKVTKKLTILLPLVALCMMILGTSPVSAASTEFLSGTSDISIYSSTGYTLMDGVREGEVTLKKSSGSTVKAHVVLVKANAKASFKPVIPNYYTSGSTKSQRVARSANWSSWGLTGVTNMVRQYQSAADTNKTVLAAINGDFGIGNKPRGSIIMEGGSEIGSATAYDDEFFFGHKSTTGTLNILQRTSSQKSVFDEAICGGAHILRNGELFGVDNETVSRQRTGIGIKNNGDTLLISVESGITVKQLAQLMQASGCWNGINMDGGGSITMVTKRSGDSNTVRRTPLSGYADVDEYGERQICSALMLVADSSTVANNVGTVSGNSITTNKNSYAVGEDVYVTASSSSDGSWVSILKADDSANAGEYFWYYTYGNHGSTWCWENGTTNNIYEEGMCSVRDGVTASTKLPPGRYRAAILNYNSSGYYQELASKYFTIEADDSTPYAMTTDKSVYTVGDPIMVTATGPSYDTSAWVGIVKSGRTISSGTGGASYYWDYISSDGSAFSLIEPENEVGDEDYSEFAADEQAMIDKTNHQLLAGTYDLYLFTSDSYSVATDANGNPVKKTITILNQDTQYSITYKDGSTTLTGLSPSSYWYSAAQSAAITLPTTVSKTGYNFVGWYDNANFSGSVVTSIPKGSTGNKTYYAKFEKKSYEVTFDTGVGKSVVSVPYGETVAEPANPTRTGYTFNGWVTVSGGSTAFNFNTAIKSDTTIYASWKVDTYTITFNSNGGSEVSQMTYTVETATFALPVPKKEKHTFIGWKDAAGKTYASITKGTTGNLTLTAQWNAAEIFSLEKVDLAYGDAVNITTYYDQTGAWIGLFAADDTIDPAKSILKYNVKATGTVVDINSTANLDEYAASSGVWYPDANGHLKSGSYIVCMFDAEGSVLDRATFTIAKGVYDVVVTPATCTEGGYTTTYYTDNTSKISDETPAAGHTGAVEGDCTADYTCTACSQLIQGKAKHTSSGAADCTTDEICTACGHVIHAATGHDWKDADCTTAKTCKTCGETEGRELGHDWTLATCTEAKSCKVCHIEDGEALGHAWLDADCFNPQTCYACGETEGEPLEHVWNDGVDIKAPSCTETGIKQFTCTRNCNTQKTETIAATGHDYNKTVVEPTCKLDGYTRYSCKNCDDVKTDNTVPAKHTPGPLTCSGPQTCTKCKAVIGEGLPHTIGPDATCTTAKECTVCHAIFEPAKGHVPDGEADCETEVSCTVCKEVIAEASGHTPGSAATCSKPQTCIDCGAVIAEAKDHTPGAAATCTSVQTCTECGEVLAEALKHTPGPAPSCETSQQCLDCGTVLASATGHTADVVPAKAATCTATGLSEGKICKSCGEILSVQTELPMLPHTVAETKVAAATMTKDGKVTHLCACGIELSSEVVNKAATVKLGSTALAYNGKVKKPAIIVKDSKGNVISQDNYTVSTPAGRKLVGTYTYKITFKGNYTGTKSLKLTIKPVKPTILAPKAEKKAVTVKWKKVSKQVTGYQVMVASNKKFTAGKKTVLIKKQGTVSKKVTGLKAKKTYYVKVRAYKTVNGVKIYSNWSKVKTIKTK